MALISVSCYKTYFYFLLFLVLEFSSTIKIKEFLDSIYSNHKNVNLLFELLNLACMNLADLLSGILVLITYISSRRKKENKPIESKKGSMELDLIYTDLSIRSNKYKLLILISVLEFFARFVDFFFFVIFSIKRIRKGEISWLVSIDFLSRILFSNLFLHTKLFKHHFVTIVTTVICLCTMSTTAFILLGNVDGANWPYFFSYALKFILMSLEDVLNKKLFNDKFLLPHTLMFYRGLFTGLLFIIFIPLIIFIKTKKPDNYFNFEYKEREVNKFLQIFLVFVYIVLYAFRNFCVMKVIYIFSPQHVAFLNQIFHLYLLIRCRIRGDPMIIIIIDCFCLLIIIFSSLIFNEIIIINAWGMSKNTRASLKIREKNESKDINSSDNEDEDEDDDDKKNTNIELTTEYKES